MSLKELNEKFLKMEENLDLFNKKIDNVFFWEKIRFPIFDRLFFVLSNHLITRKNHTIIDILKVGIRSIKTILFMNPFFSSSRDILFLGHNRRKLQEDGKWWDIYCDPIIADLKRSYLLIEYYYNFTHRTPAKTTDLRYLDFFVLLFVLQKIFRLKKVSFSKKEKILLNNIQIEIQTTFGTEININKMLEIQLLQRKVYLPIFIRLLKRVRPKLVILVVSYNIIGEALIEASKRMNIPVIELQHGVINRYHFGYSYPGQERKKRFFVDYLFAFGDFWKDSTNFPIDKEKIFCVGFPSLEKELDKYKDIIQKDQILFISGGSASKALSKFAVEFSKKTHHNNTILYKLHPGEYRLWKKNFPWLLDSDIQVVDNDNISLYQLFAESKIQIGANSTALYEGLMFGIRTYIVYMFGIEYMEFLIENGAVKMISSIDELEESIATEKNLPEVNPDIFFKKNALNNIYEKIDELIASHTDSSKHTQSLGKKTRS